MTQNLLSTQYTPSEIAEMDAALAVLERLFARLPELTPEQRRQLVKMGDKSEAFCRQTLLVLAQNPDILPPGLDLAEAQKDLAQLDLLRPRILRITRLAGRGEDADTAFGSDIISTSLDGYALLKVLGRGTGLEGLRQSMSVRLSRGPKPAKPPAGGEA